MSVRGPPPPPPHHSGSMSSIQSPPPPPPPAQQRQGSVSVPSLAAPNRPPPPPPTHAPSPRSQTMSGDAPYIPPRPLASQPSTPDSSGPRSSPPPMPTIGIPNSASASPTPSPTVARPTTIPPPNSGTGTMGVSEVIAVPEDHPAFWRELQSMRSATRLFSDGLDEFMGRVFFPRRKAPPPREEKSSIFSFVTRPTNNANASASSNLLAGLAGLASPSASSGLGQASLSSTGVNSSALSSRATAAQQSIDQAKNKSFLTSYAQRAATAAQPVEQVSSLVAALSLQKAQLDERLESLERYPSQFADMLDAVQHKLSEHDETKKVVLQKLQKYLGHKVGTNVEKALEQEKKIRTRRQLMSGLRFEASCDLKRMAANEELNVLRPMSSVLQLYWDFFQTGYKMLQPLAEAGSISSLATYVAQLEEQAERQSQTFAMSKRLHESSLQAHLGHSSAFALNNSLTGAGQQGSTGIRDLDAASRLHAGTKAVEKEGYLYLPAPNFCPVFASITKGHLLLSRDALNLPDLNIDLLICTVKENRDAKLRWVFNIISPTETLLLQADSAEGFQEWMGVIQNAISAQLNAGNSAGGRGGSNTARTPNGASSPDRALDRNAAMQSSSSNAAGSASGSSAGGDSNGANSKEENAVLAVLRAVPGNHVCADCEARDPEWVSLNLGILICMECSGLHRALGVHVSKVRSTTLDKLDPYMVSYLCAVGNNLARSVWEASLLLTDASKRSRPNASSNATMRSMFIKAKYDLRSFLAPTREKNKSELNEMMFFAIENGLLPQLIESLAWGANPAWPNPAAENRTALHQAVMYANLIIVECVIQFMPGELNKKELRGWTPIHYAAYQNDKALVELLILRGGSQLACELDAGGQTPLASALAQCLASGEDIVPEVQQLLAAAEEKVRARNAR